MTIPAQAVIDRARIPLNDADKVRYSDIDLLAYLNAGIALIRSKRPEMFYGTPHLAAGTSPVVTLADIMPLPDTLALALADYVTGRAETVDDEHAVSGRVQMFLQLAVEGVS